MQIPVEFVSGDYKYILTHYEIDKEEYNRILLLCSVHKDDIVQSWSRNNYPGVSDQSSEVKKIENNQEVLVKEPEQISNNQEQITDEKILNIMSVVD